MGRGKRNLTDKQESFCQEYVVDKVAKRAAKAAGYSEKTAEILGYQLLQNPSVRARIDELLEKQAKRTQITADRVLEELSHVAFMDLSLAYDEAGRLLNVKDMPEPVRRSVSAIKVFEEFEGSGRSRTKVGETRELKPFDKVAALKALGQHLRLFADRVEHSGPDGRPIEYRDVSKLSDEELDAQILALSGSENKADT